MPAHVPAQFLQGTRAPIPASVTAQFNRLRAKSAALVARTQGQPFVPKIFPVNPGEDLVALRSAAQANARKFNPPPTPDPPALFKRPAPTGPPADFGLVRSKLGKGVVDAALSGQPAPVITTVALVPIPKKIPRSDTRVMAPPPTPRVKAPLVVKPRVAPPRLAPAATVVAVVPSAAAAQPIVSIPVIREQQAMIATPPNEQRGIVHKRIGKGIKSAFDFVSERVTGGGPCRPGQISVAGQCLGGSMAFPRTRTTNVEITGTASGSNFGVGPQLLGPGTVVAGGPLVPGAVAPVQVAIPRSFCPPSFVVGIDGMCYHRKLIPNQFRRWPKPTKPLLTGGDVNILRKASSLEKRIKTLSKKYLPRPCPKR